MTKAIVAVLALGALGITAPSAVADDPRYVCQFEAFAQEDLTGQNWEGAASGHVAHVGGGTAAIRCFITVNGSEAASISTGIGNGAAATSGRITFAARDTDLVGICAEVTTPHGGWSHCAEVSDTQLPPQEVLDLVGEADSIFGGPILCGTVPPGYYPPDIYVASDGDVYRNGRKVYDCPPYGDPAQHPRSDYKSGRVSR